MALPRSNSSLLTLCRIPCSVDGDNANSTNSLKKLLAIALLVITGCSKPAGSDAEALQPIASPDGTMTLIPSIKQAETNPVHHHCVVIEVHNDSADSLYRTQTPASDTHKWAAGWFDNRTVVLYSSDVGTMAWQLIEDKEFSLLPTPLKRTLLDFGEKLKQDKYKGG